MKKRLASIVKAPLGLFGKPASVVTNKLSQATGSVSFLDTLRNKDIRKKLLFTMGILVVYRILNAVPLPGIDVRLFVEVFQDSPLTNIFTLVTGGRLDNPSLVSIGLGAYINASIVIQLLQTVIPKLEELSKEGERGRRTLNQYTRILTVPLSAIQGFVIYTILSNVGTTVPELAGIVDGITPMQIITMIVSLTAGSIILMWLGELISENGIGNGISIMITVSILAALPTLVARDFAFLAEDLQLLANGNFNVLVNENFLTIYAVIIGMILLVMGVVFINEAVRKITIQYARRFRGDGMQGSYLPLKINQAGVIPVIFASALLTFPQIITQFVLSSADTGSWLFERATELSQSFLGLDISQMNDGQILKYFGLYALLIVGFTFFYTFVTYKPSETADNLKKSGGFIPGLRPGKATERFITHVLLRLTVVGSIFLAVVSLIPSAVRLTPQGANLTVIGVIGGTSILIIVGVILDTIRQAKSLTVSISYDQYK